MYTFTLNRQKLNMPNTLSELTYADFLRFIACKTDLEKIEVLTGENLRDLPSDCEKAMSNIIALMDKFESQVNDYLAGRKDPEETTTVNVFDKVVKFDKNLGQLPYWPFTKVKDVIKKMGKEPFNSYEYYTALVGHYLYSKLNEYDEYKAEAFSEEYVSAMPFTDVIALGDFFLFIQHRLWMTNLNYLKAKLQMKKKKLASMFLLSTAN